MNLRYNKRFKPFRRIAKYTLNFLYPGIKRLFTFPKVLSISETLELLNDNDDLSIVRFGDGELLYIVDKINLPFQSYDKRLANSLITILGSNDPNILVGLPSGYYSLESLSRKGRIFWRAQVSWVYPRLRKYIDLEKIYANASITRVYAEYSNKDHCSVWFDMFKKIWKDKEVVIIEGEESRVGVGNDLLSGAISIERVLGPRHHAYAKYDELFAIASKLGRHKLLLIALGPCAKPLVYNLSKMGYRVIDIGNLDIEYEWFLRNAKSKIKIPGKYTSEAVGGRDVENVADENYTKQIISRITLDS